MWSSRGRSRAAGGCRAGRGRDRCARTAGARRHGRVGGSPAPGSTHRSRVARTRPDAGRREIADRRVVIEVDPVRTESPEQGDVQDDRQREEHPGEDRSLGGRSDAQPR